MPVQLFIHTEYMLHRPKPAELSMLMDLTPKVKLSIVSGVSVLCCAVTFWKSFSLHVAFEVTLLLY